MSDDKKIIFSMTGVSKILPNNNKAILKDIFLSFYHGAKIGIIGLNGSGKSTLLKIIAGVEKNFQGDVVFVEGYSVGYLEQEPQLDETKTVIDIVKEGVSETVSLLDEYNLINEQFGLPEVYENPDRMEKLMNRQSEVQDRIDATNAWEVDTVLSRAMDALQCPEGDTSISILSGGERRRVALCRLLLRNPDVLLLDEPTNHLDAESILWLEHHLQQYKGTVIAVTHDRYFLDNVAGWILELDRGEGIPWKGNYTEWLEQKTKRLQLEEKHATKRRRTLERELDWVRMNPKGRQAKSKARLSNYDKLLGQEQKDKEQSLEIFIPNGPRLGDNVIDAEHVKKGFGDKLLYEDLNFKLPPAGIVGIVGPNGAGKTTIFRMIMDQLQADSGVFKVGETAKISYVDQSHEKMDPEKSIYEIIGDGQEQFEIGKQIVNSRAYLARFNFSGGDQSKKVGVLLDEPTNDLDINTLRALEEALYNFAGCAVIISHDRWFMDRVCTHILAFEGDSQVYYYEGSFSEYEENKKKRLGGSSLEPKKFKYKKLVK